MYRCKPKPENRPPPGGFTTPPFSGTRPTSEKKKVTPGRERNPAQPRWGDPERDKRLDIGMKEEGAISFPQNNSNRTQPEKFQSRSRTRLNILFGTRSPNGRSPLLPGVVQTVPFPAFLPRRRFIPRTMKPCQFFKKPCRSGGIPGILRGFSGSLRNRKTARHFPGIRLLE